MGRIEVIKCPHCKSSGSSVALVELWGGSSITFDQSDDGTIEAEGYMKEGDPQSVHGKCLGCSHRWRIRKAKQITDLRGYGDQARKIW